MSLVQWENNWLKMLALSKRWWTMMKRPTANRVGRKGKAVYAESHEKYVASYVRQGLGRDKYWEKEIVKQNDDSQCNKSYCCFGYKANLPQPFTYNYPFQRCALIKLHAIHLLSIGLWQLQLAQGISPGRCVAYQMLPQTKAACSKYIYLLLTPMYDDVF